MLSFKFRVIYNLAKKFFKVKFSNYFAKGNWPRALVRIETKRTKEKADKYR